MVAAEQGKPPLHPARSAASALLLACGAVFLSSCGAYFLVYPHDDPLARLVALAAAAGLALLPGLRG